MANGHGGFRPGAGRKSQATQDAQSNKMDIAHDVIPLDRWRKIIDAQARKAEQGDTRAFAELAPWMMGGKPNAPLEVIHSGEQGRQEFRAMILQCEIDDAVDEATA